MGRTEPWRRWVTREHADVWNPGGRFGPRRVRVNECWFVLKAENVYTEAMAYDASKFAPGSRGTAAYTLGGRQWSAEWEVRQNAVWRLGRVFLRCPRCSGRCTRLYLPREDSWLACRKCWGLTYASRTLQNYKQTWWGGRRFGWMFRTTQRDWALEQTDERRKERRRLSRERWQQRRHMFPQGNAPDAS